MKTQKTEWKQAKCPVCGKEYSYLVAYKPKTCSSFECVQESSTLAKEVKGNRKIKH